MPSDFRAVRFVGAARDELLAFPADARRAAGFQLYRVQCGLDPSDWRPLRSIGPGVREIRVHVPQEYRVVYVASFGEAVYVLHAFRKKSQKTPMTAINLARHRLSDLARARRGRSAN
jgi:phage-related protein